MNPLKATRSARPVTLAGLYEAQPDRQGELRTLIERDGLKGVTSNPSIFEKAIGETDEYADALKQFQAQARPQHFRDLRTSCNRRYSCRR